MKPGDDKKKTSSAKKERIRILIADDHSVVREGLVSLIKRKSDMVVVAEASNGREAVDLWRKHRPDITLLDLRMRTGWRRCDQEIRQLDETAHVIVLTTFDGDEDIYRAIEAGAKVTCEGHRAICARHCIRRVHAGETYWPPTLAAKLAERVSGEALSVREIEVLWRIAQERATRRSVPSD